MSLRTTLLRSAKLLPTPRELPLSRGRSRGRGLQNRGVWRASSGMQQGSFKSAQDVEAWLQRYGIDTAAYGKGAAKPIELLWLEVQEGETALTVGPDGAPLRQVSVLNVLVRSPSNPGKVLYEAEQLLPTGARRVRGLPLAEKLLPGEGWREAVPRAVMEELGPALPPWEPSIAVEEGSYQRSVETKESQSYPGLRSEYVCHRVGAVVEGLPAGDFVTREDRADGLLQHCWAWR